MQVLVDQVYSISSDFPGTPNCGVYAGGGGGGADGRNCSDRGLGGPGGGGNGAAGGSPAPRDAGSAGTANTGGGGGGAGLTPACGHAGGSGIVIVKELDKASGVWSLNEQIDALDAGTWPKREATIDYLVVAGGGGGGDITQEHPGNVAPVVEVVQEVTEHQDMALLLYKEQHLV